MNNERVYFNRKVHCPTCKSGELIGRKEGIVIFKCPKCKIVFTLIGVDFDNNIKGNIAIYEIGKIGKFRY